MGQRFPCADDRHRCRFAVSETKGDSAILVNPQTLRNHGTWRELGGGPASEMAVQI